MLQGGPLSLEVVAGWLCLYHDYLVILCKIVVGVLDKKPEDCEFCLVLRHEIWLGDFGADTFSQLKNPTRILMRGTSEERALCKVP